MDKALSGPGSSSDLPPHPLCDLGQVTLMIMTVIMALFTEHLLCSGLFTQVISSKHIGPSEMGWVGDTTRLGR